MNKLLHEQLRHIVNTGLSECTLSKESIDFVRVSLKLKGDKVSYAKDMQNILNYIADEIEKYYIPRPRFKDGEPVQFGDVFRTELGNVECVAIEYNEYNAWAKDGTDDDWNSSISADKLAKIHRLPKLLDADGVEIKVGETVWVKNSPFEPLLVSGFKDGRVLMSYHNETSLGYKSTSLTHREPDSLEKLRDDLRDLVPFMPADEFTVNAHDLISITNRLTAIMERDA